MADVGAFFREALRPEGRASFFDGLSELWLCVLVAFAPAAFGGAGPVGELVLVSLGVLLAVSLTLKLLLSPEAGGVRTWAYLPVVLFLLVVGLQLLPWPSFLAGVVSPAAAEHWSRALPDAGAAPLTVYPHATWRDLRLLLVASVAFVAVVNVVSRREQVERLLLLMVSVTAAALLLFVDQRWMGTSAIYGLVPVDGEPYGPFASRSAFSLFLCLGFGACVAALLTKLNRRGRRASSLEKLWRRVGKMKPAELTWAGVATGVGLLALGATYVADSAVGMLALWGATLGGLLVLGRTWYRQQHKAYEDPSPEVRSVTMVGVLVAGGVLVAAKRVVGALGSGDGPLGEGIRVSIDWLRIWTDFPLFGAGQGTVDTLYPAYQHVLKEEGLAEGFDAVRLLAETGLLGGAAAALFAGAIAVALLRAATRRAVLPLAAHGLAIGLLAAVIHAALGTGLRVPSNAVWAAVLAGLGVSLARYRRKEETEDADEPSDPRSLRGVRTLGGVGVVVAGIGGGLLIDQAASVVVARSRAEAAVIGQEEQPPKVADQKERITKLADAVSAAPGAAHHRYRLARARWRAILLSAAATGVGSEQEGPASSSESPTTGPFRSGTSAANGAERLLDEIRDARGVCPVHAGLWELEGQIRWVLGEREKAMRRFERAVELSRADPQLLEVAGALAVRDGSDDVAMERWRRAVRVDPARFRPIARIAIHQLGRPHLALRLAGDEPKRLVQVYRASRGRPDLKQLAERARKKAVRALEAAIAKPGASAEQLARLASLKAEAGDHAAAARYYREALQLERDRLDWWRARAKALKAAGRLEEAVQALGRAKDLPSSPPEVGERLKRWEQELKAAGKPSGEG